MKYAIASLMLAFVFLGTVPSNASVISDTFRYNNAPTRTEHSRPNVQRRYHNSYTRQGAYNRNYATHSYVPVSRTSRRVVHTAYRPNTIGQRPSKWCGWYMRQIKGGGPQYNLAKNWMYYGVPTSPSIGAVVVWPHHVGYIVNRDSRGWIVRSGNWNNRIADVPLNRMPRNVIAYRI